MECLANLDFDFGRSSKYLVKLFKVDGGPLMVIVFRLRALVYARLRCRIPYGSH